MVRKTLRGKQCNLWSRLPEVVPHKYPTTTTYLTLETQRPKGLLLVVVGSNRQASKRNTKVMVENVSCTVSGGHD